MALRIYQKSLKTRCKMDQGAEVSQGVCRVYLCDAWVRLLLALLKRVRTGTRWRWTAAAAGAWQARVYAKCTYVVLG